MARLVRRSGDLPKRSLWQRIKDIALADVNVLARGGVQAGSLERLEEILLDADFGVSTTLKLVAEVEAHARRGEARTAEEFRQALAESVERALRAGNSDPALLSAPQRPTVILVIGVNGAGKTTFIGKLAARLKGQGKRVMVAAGDTFRAGAIEQLRLWAQRTGVDFIGAQAGGDPAALGRLHTSGGLMDELRKVVRVIQRRLPTAPHETLLVLDGTIGQNAVAQARTFAASVPVTGLVVTKLDGTAKGGIVVAVHEAINVPVKFLGVGETAADLVPFDAHAFAQDVLEE